VAEHGAASALSLAPRVDPGAEMNAAARKASRPPQFDLEALSLGLNPLFSSLLCPVPPGSAA
jgi:hypothetical protein